MMRDILLDVESENKPVKVNICVIHYTKLAHRKKTIDNIRQTFETISKKNPRIQTEIKEIENFDPDKLHPDFVKRIFNADELKSPDNLLFNKFKIQNPNANMISNCLKHLEALKYLSTKGEHDINLILEDDVFYNDKFESQFEEFVRLGYYKSFDMVFFGLPGEKPSIYSDGGPTVVVSTTINGNGLLPCCDSYYVNRKTVARLLELYVPIKYPHNIQLSYLIDKDNINCGRTYPNLLVDGSKIGFTTSTISPNNILLFNNAYKMVYKLLDKAQLTPDDIKLINGIFENNSAKDNPDFLFLEGLFNMKLANYGKTKELFDRAYIGYEQNMSPLTNQSALIQNYIDLAKHLQ